MPHSYGSILCRNFVYIPEEILVEILKRLPVKSLLRCRCVHKSWYNLVKTPMFINLHLNHQRITTTHNHKSLVFRTIYPRELLLRNDDEQCQESQFKLEFPPDLQFMGRNSISSGLMCFFDMNENICLWNPFIQKFKTLPRQPRLPSGSALLIWYCPCLAFGYVPHINDYRVVQILNYIDQNEVQSFMIFVYSLSTNLWKTKILPDKFCIRIPSDEYIFVNGTAFWTGATVEGVKTFLCFDTINDILRTISLPAEALSCKPFLNALHQFGESLAYFVVDPTSTALNMWVLKKDSMNKFFWEKKICVNLKEKNYFRALGVRDNGELILSKIRKCDLISYNIVKDEINDFAPSWHRWFPSRITMGKEDDFYGVLSSVSPILESLVLLDTV